MNEDCEEIEVPPGTLKSIRFSISNNKDREIMASLKVEAANQVSDSRLGLPNPDLLCRSCGSIDRKVCEGHFGVIKFQHSIINPHLIPDVVALLNKICPGCKHIRKKQFQVTKDQPERCRYCITNTGYPQMKFRVTTKEVFRRTGIICEVSEDNLSKLRKRGVLALPPDYWKFLLPDSNIDESSVKPTKRILTHAQVYHLLSGIDKRLIKKDIPMFDSLALTSFPVTPNGYRITEMVNQFSGPRLVFDERTRIYRKLVGFEGNGLELSSRAIECFQYSRLYSETVSSSKDNPYQKKPDTPKLCGLRFMKDVLLGKRNDHTFRTVVVGDPSLKVNEIGIPKKIAERLQVSENLNNWNRERLVTSCFHRLLERGELHVRRGGNLVTIQAIDDLRTGDKISRSLKDGDTVLMNRPPSIHQHSFIAMSAKILPTTSVVSLNPICCLPFRGDFDGDCLHGYVPQSIQAKVELDELVALDKQLVNRQNGYNLLSLGQDSLTAAYLVNVEKNRYLNRAQMQQLQMYCPFQLPPPAIIRASPSSSEPQWTGMQLFGMLFPPGFDYAYPRDNVVVSDGEVLSSSEGSSWLRDGEGNFIQGLVKHDKEKVLDIIYSAQEMLSQWLLTRGLSVSLADLYLSSDPQSRRNLQEEIKYGLQDAEKICNKQQLMVESRRDFLAVNGEPTEKEDLVAGLAQFCYERQRSATLSKLAVSAFKDAFRDVQALAYRYGDESNSFLIMSKAGSKGNIGKLMQHSVCVGLQNSSVALSFGFPRELNCAAWNDPNSPLRGAKRDEKSAFVPFGVIQNSFLTGLNPLEAFVHSVTSRDGSFSGHADLPGALSRRLMFFMRDIYAAYDGTVRHSFGNYLVQFSYEPDDPAEDMTGEAVGSLSACALTEAAYSALDQPISLLETSPLLNLKNILECGSKNGQREQTMSLYLSEDLSKKKHGFEYGSLDIKNHLEKLCFSEIVSTSMIIYSPGTNSKTSLSPWVCHFHISEKLLKRNQLNIESVVSSLNKQYLSRRKELKLDLFSLIIESTNDCSAEDAMEDGTFCITVTVVKASKQSSLELDAIRLVLIPFLLDSPVKGYREIKKVDILWVDRPKAPKRNGKNSTGELFLRVTMYGLRGNRNCWSALLETCLPVMDMIDWSRSHPDNIRQCCSVYGIDAGRSVFLANLESAVSDTGKAILREHLLLVADALSVTGEFVALNAKGWSKQRQADSTPAPFTQACFSSPSQVFLKAAKEGVRDELQGSIDALSWGKVPCFGTGDQFEIIISPKNHGVTAPVDPYDFLRSTASLPKAATMCATDYLPKQDKLTEKPFSLLENALSKAVKILDTKGLSSLQLKKIFTWDDIEKFSRSLKRILYNYEIDALLNERDKTLLRMALFFHPNGAEKLGSGFQGIKVANSKHENARCFEVIRSDGTKEDFSYHKCVLGAVEIIAPTKINFYKSKYLKRGTV